jgi:hypothetical protein
MRNLSPDLPAAQRSGSGVPDSSDGVIDACPNTPRLAERQGCPVG